MEINHNDKNIFSRECIKEMQCSMIQQSVAGYDPERDYTLWIDANLFNPFKGSTCGQITLTSNTGKDFIISVEPNFFPERAIYHLNANKQLYGVPLIFNSFEELESIKTVKIEWETEAMNEENEITSIAYTQITRDVFFENSYIPSQKVYTLLCEDISPLVLYQSHPNEIEKEANSQYINVFSKTQIGINAPEVGYIMRTYQKILNEIGQMELKKTCVETEKRARIVCSLSGCNYQGITTLIFIANEQILLEASDIANIPTNYINGFKTTRKKWQQL